MATEEAFLDTFSTFNRRGYPRSGQYNHASTKEAMGNSGLSHMNQAYPKSYFDELGFLSLRDEPHRYHLCINIENRSVRNRTLGGVRGFAGTRRSKSLLYFALLDDFTHDPAVMLLSVMDPAKHSEFLNSYGGTFKGKKDRKI